LGSQAILIIVIGRGKGHPYIYFDTTAFRQTKEKGSSKDDVIHLTIIYILLYRGKGIPPYYFLTTFLFGLPLFYEDFRLFRPSFSKTLFLVEMCTNILFP